MKTECKIPVHASPFKFNQQFQMVIGDAQESCSTKLDAKAQAACQGYTEWSGYTGSASQFLQGAADVEYKFLSKKNPTLAMKIYHGIGIGATIFYGANQQFLQAITDINAGKKYEPIEVPDNPPPFNPNPPSDGSTVEEAIKAFWGALQPWLEKVIAKMANKYPNSPWIKILEGIITSSQLWIKQLEDIFDEQNQQTLLNKAS